MFTVYDTRHCRVMPCCIEIKGLHPVARLRNYKRKNRVGRVANQRHMMSRSERKSLQADGFMWWQQQNFLYRKSFNPANEKYKADYKAFSAAAEAKAGWK